MIACCDIFCDIILDLEGYGQHWCPKFIFSMMPLIIRIIMNNTAVLVVHVVVQIIWNQVEPQHLTLYKQKKHMSNTRQAP